MIQYVLGGFMNEVYSFLDSLNINPKDYLVVGVSFGPDSMFLLDILRKHYSNKIICAHVHHNHRKESDKEAADLKKYCKDNNIIFEYMKIDSYTNNKFTEEEARSKRYEFFDELMNKYNSKYLFTAHHGDDLTETILMRLVRGSSISGYAGIPLISKRNSYELVRPLLYLNKEYIVSYCDENSIPYAIDITNLTDEQTRNRYRNNVLSFLKKENENVHLKFLNFSNKLKEYDDYINNIVFGVYNKVIKDNVIDVILLNKEDNLIIKKVIEFYLKNIYQDDIKRITDVQVGVILSMVKSDKSNIVNSMPMKKNIVKSYNKIYFDNDIDYNDYCFILEDYLELPNDYVIEKVSSKPNNSNYITLLNSAEVKLPLYVRNRLDGDKIKILNMKGSKKIKDIFIDEKIDIKKRNNYPVLVDSNGKILWVPGIKKSKYDKSKEGFYDIILEYHKKEGNNESKQSKC